MDEKDREFWRSMYMLASVGINIVVATFIGLGMGWVIDHKLFPLVFHVQTEPWFTMTFLLFGIIAGFRNVFSMVKSKYEAGELRDKEEGPEAGGDFKDKDKKEQDKYK
ncbi:MAG: AtpZ/AtpI family protein [Nitrospirota bacterium]